MIDAKPPLSVSEWVKAKVASGSSLTVTRGGSKNSTTLTFQITDITPNATTRWEFELDERHGFLPVQMRYRYQSKSKPGAFNAETSIVKEMKSIKDIWIPTLVERTTST